MITKWQVTEIQTRATDNNTLLPISWLITGTPWHDHITLNTDKTQFIWLWSPLQLASVRMEELSIGGAAVAPVDTARDLSVTLDAQLTLDKHVDSVVRS